MREIKFRGLRPLDNKWLFGSLVTGLFHNVNTKVESCNIMDASDYPNFDCFQDFDNMDTDVVPETVGQFTGLKDKNGIDIYEGDIVSCPFQDRMETSKGVRTKFLNLPIVFEKGSFSFKIAKVNIHPFRFHPNIEDCVIIGNIHQNPELLSSTS